MDTTTKKVSGSVQSSALSPVGPSAPVCHQTASTTAPPTTFDELRLAAQAVLMEADARAESKHPMAYICPWKQLTRLRKALKTL